MFYRKMIIWSLAGFVVFEVNLEIVFFQLFQQKTKQKIISLFQTMNHFAAFDGKRRCGNKR